MGKPLMLSANDFEIKYVERHGGWVVLCCGELWGVFAYDDEWAAIDALKSVYPEFGRKLEYYHMTACS